MSFHRSDDEIVRLGRSVADLSLPKPEWTHAAHFAFALWLLADGERNAFREAPGLIRAYNVATGVSNTDTSGYHETITLASLHVARDMLGAARAPSAALADIGASRFAGPDWLLTHWSRARLFSADARRRWIDPDLVPLSEALRLTRS